MRTPDGVGAALKRQVDQIVSRGTDIMSSEQFWKELKIRNTSIQLNLIDPEVINNGVKQLSEMKLNNIPGIMSIHQVLTVAMELVNQLSFKQKTQLPKSHLERHILLKR